MVFAFDPTAFADSTTLHAITIFILADHACSTVVSQELSSMGAY